jgi:flagellar L-ring protein FlgH
MRNAATHIAHAALISLLVCCVNASARTKVKQDSQQLRQDYIARMERDTPSTQPVMTLGSLYLPDSSFTDMASDYKAHHLGDVVTLLVAETTAASSTGDVNTQRTFQASSAITGVPGQLKAGPVNPLLAMNSAKQIKGQGETSAGSNVTATVSAHVIAVLSSGNMVVEAERKILINSQNEDLIVRGVLRPGDIGPNNIAPATALANLEIELKGKGVVSDSIGRPNPIIRGLLWLFNW